MTREAPVVLEENNDRLKPVPASVSRRGRPREEEHLQLWRLRKGVQAQGGIPGTPENPFPGRKWSGRCGIWFGTAELGPVVRLHVLREKIPDKERFPGSRGDGAHPQVEAQVHPRGLQRGLLLLQRACYSYPVKRRFRSLDLLFMGQSNLVLLHLKGYWGTFILKL